MLIIIEGVLGHMVQAGEAAQYDIRTRLLTASQVSQSVHIPFGVLASLNELAVQVVVFDTANQALLVSFTAKGDSTSHPSSSENDIDDAKGIKRCYKINAYKFYH